MPATTTATTGGDISDLLPLPLLRSQLVPPSPTPLKSAIDWLPDFAGAAWIAYGAASLLVVAHCAPPGESEVGPCFRQAIEPPEESGEDVRAVKWCPSVPSDGVVAVGEGRHVRLYAPGTDEALGALCWRQIADLVQSTMVEAIEWTGSGDGLITVGIEVVWWKRKTASWEITYRLREEVPQSIVSTTLFIDGPVAVATNPSNSSSSTQAEGLSTFSKKETAPVSVCQVDGKYGFLRVELCHPQLVSMIQWRPLHLERSRKNNLCSPRDVLLTCGLDGIVRLWSEIDSDISESSSKDTDEHKTLGKSYRVIAVLEINQCLKGNLGIDIFICWGAEIHSSIHSGSLNNSLSPERSDCDQTGHCEWLVAVGPGSCVTFWTIHCLDDAYPIRFPRLNLWKKHNLKGPNFIKLCTSESSELSKLPILIRTVASRDTLFGPPVTYSLLYLSPENSISWLLWHSPVQSSIGHGSQNVQIEKEHLSCFRGGFQNHDGHSGSIIHIAVHPGSPGTELAASMDSNGSIFFWSISAISACTLGMENLSNPSWKLIGRIVPDDLPNRPIYSTMSWAPCIFDEDRFILMGHAEGIDCFQIGMSNEDEDNGIFLCHKIFTIPFPTNCYRKGSYNIFVTSLGSVCSSNFSKFKLSAIWRAEFQVLSWQVVMHSDLSRRHTSNCNPDTFAPLEGRHGFSCPTKSYHMTADLCSSGFPISGGDQVTSFAVISPNYLISSSELLNLPEDSFNTTPIYEITTGFSDGSLRFWRSGTSRSSSQYDMRTLSWELVGMLTAHDGPVAAISVSDCGTKLATICLCDSSDISVLHIWRSNALVGGGCFSLEDKITITRPVATLSWLTIGNGRLLLGVCMKSEIFIYSQRRIIDQVLSAPAESLDTANWFCIAKCQTKFANKGFLWGPKASLVVIHEKHFSIFNHWSLRTNNESQKINQRECEVYDSDSHDQDISCDFSNCKIREPETRKSFNISEVHSENSSLLESIQLCQTDMNSKLYSILGIVDELCGELATYHPKALLLHLHSGNWRRAYACVEHLVRWLQSVNSSTTNTEEYNSGDSSVGIPEICLANYVGEIHSAAVQNNKMEWGLNVPSRISETQLKDDLFHVGEGSSWMTSSGNISSSTSQQSNIKGFTEVLEKASAIFRLDDTERVQLLAVVDLLGLFVDPHYSSVYESFDGPARRFWVASKYQHLYFSRKFGRLASQDEVIAESWMISWALLSDCQENLYNSLISSEPSWMEMRNVGIGYWFTHVAQLRPRIEKLARSQYLSRRDPKDCALLYLALNRLQVLSGLFKISKDERDKPLVGFLLRNFQEEKNKAAALKNAYVLLGKHQLELAAAFFLLGGDPSSAVTICAKNLKDEQLAILICRLIEGNGGSLEYNLVTNILLPSATERGDRWLCSLHEWTLGNFFQSYKVLVNFPLDSANNNCETSCNYASNPYIGQYCLSLAAKNNLRNAVGDEMAAILLKWATCITATALVRCGLPLEAMECMSATLNNHKAKDQSHYLAVGEDRILQGNLDPFSNLGSNWLLLDVANCLEYNFCLNAALQHVSRLLQEYPGWEEGTLASPTMLPAKLDARHRELQMKFKSKLKMTITVLEQRYSLKSSDVIDMILINASSKEMTFLGYSMLHDYIADNHVGGIPHSNGGFDSVSVRSSVIKASKDICYFLARYSLHHNILNSLFTMSRNSFCKGNSWQFISCDILLRRSFYLIKTILGLLKSHGPTLFKADNYLDAVVVLAHLQLCFCFASAWLTRSFNELAMIILPITNAFNKKQPFHEATGVDMIDFVSQIMNLIVQSKPRKMFHVDADQCQNEGHGLDVAQEEIMRELIGTSMWRTLHDFIKYQFTSLITETNDFKSSLNPVETFSFHLLKPLITAVAYAFSTLERHLASWFLNEAENGAPLHHLFDVESIQADLNLEQHFLHLSKISELMNKQDQKVICKLLLGISIKSENTCAGSIYKIINSPSFSRWEFCGSWDTVQRVVLIEQESMRVANGSQDAMKATSSASSSTSAHFSDQPWDRGSEVNSRRKERRSLKEETYFRIPEEVCKRSGELIEAICFNNVHEQQMAFATNKKRIIFLNVGLESIQEQAEYIWPDCDWPHDGWAGLESTPVPASVSIEMGPGRKEGANLGRGDDTIGTVSSFRPGRDLTGGGAFGIPGYAGMGASGFGWDEHEFTYPPATTENISTRALSSHPSKPIFLVGSYDSHVYLWEFGKASATATYGVLPAANFSSHALASVSALQFDCYGQRFATASLDGSICTWQVEVGGRSDMHPSESSHCFDKHAWDVAYMTASGSVIAAVGLSSSNVNAIIWDTLAPPSKTRVSLTCHEGGARSVSVLDDRRGGGSIPSIVITGGKSGDIELHDSRYMTGRIERHKHSAEQRLKSPVMQNTSASGENMGGMLWHIPTAHLGSITKISSVPNTSLFLTGSNDGDVKLWDAKRCELVFHWPKLHERHTFLQSSSRGFGSVVRAAVTDIKVSSYGFLSCGGDGTVKQISLKGSPFRS